MHKIELEPYIGKSGQLYNVYFEGQLVLKAKRDPEYAACRYLKGLGKTGNVCFLPKGATQIRSTIKDLVSGASYTVTEGNSGLTMQKYQEFKG